jgi:hypothetical protein
LLDVTGVPYDAVRHLTGVKEMGSAKEELLAAAEDAWESSPEGRAWRRSRDRANREHVKRRQEPERRWAIKHPVEWAEWCKLQPLLMPQFGVQHEFPDFLREVGVAPSSDHVIVQKDTGQPYQWGNLMWSGNRHVARAAGGRVEEGPLLQKLGELQQTIIDRFDRFESNQSLAVTKEAYTTVEAAQRLGRVEWTVRQWCNKGRVKGAYKVRGKGRKGEWRIPHDTVVELQRDGTPPEGTYRKV